MVLCSLITYDVESICTYSSKCFTDCGFRAHKKCSEKIPNDCMPNMKKLKRMFGLDLTTLLKATNKSIPFVVEKCVEEIERRGRCECTIHVRSLDDI